MAQRYPTPWKGRGARNTLPTCGQTDTRENIRLPSRNFVCSVYKMCIALFALATRTPCEHLRLHTRHFVGSRSQTRNDCEQISHNSHCVATFKWLNHSSGFISVLS